MSHAIYSAGRLVTAQTESKSEPSMLSERILC
jgi:hypothetical protein